jgi:hypothetical protein
LRSTGANGFPRGIQNLHYLHIQSRRNGIFDPGVIGQIGNTLGKLGVNVATFALGRREAQRGADAVSLVHVYGEVSASIRGSILGPIRAIPAITEAKLVLLGQGFDRRCLHAVIVSNRNRK